MSAAAIRLLFLEDNAGDALLVRTALAEHAPGEFSITGSERLADALARIRAGHFDAMLCDLGLPDSTGLATAQAIAGRVPALPLVVLTGSDDQKLGRESIRHGAQDYLIKGKCSGALIARTLHYAIERKRLEIALRTANEVLEQRVAERTAELSAVNATLLASEERFRLLFESSRDALMTLAPPSWCFTSANQATLELFGTASAHAFTEFGPWHFSPLQQPDGRLSIEKAQEMIATAMREGKIFFEWEHQRCNGSRFPAEVLMTRMDLGTKVFLQATIRDISERKRTEDQIKLQLDQLKTALMSTIEVITTLSEMRDPYTTGHERRVADIAVAIGAALGFDAQRQEGLQVAAHLHDIGKITVPAEILAKPGKLSPIEYQLIQAHPQASYDVLKHVRFPWPVAEVALQHHERMDGSGYPQGLKGESIRLEARILAVADVVDAMSSHRPYRAALGMDKALAEIERGRGTAYDANVVDACVKLYREKHHGSPD